MPTDGSAAVGVVGSPASTSALRRSLAAAGVTLCEPVSDRCRTIVTLLPTEPALRAAIEAIGDGTRGLTVLDLSPIAPSTQRNVAAASRAVGMTLFGGYVMSRPSDRTIRTTLFVDDEATQAPALRGVLAGLADDVVATGCAGRAKAIGLLDALLAGVNAAAVAEALTLGRCAGLDMSALVALLQKGSGATTIMAHPDDAAETATQRLEALARVADCAQRVDHSLFFGSSAIAALLARRQRERGPIPTREAAVLLAARSAS